MRTRNSGGPAAPAHLGVVLVGAAWAVTALFTVTLLVPATGALAAVRDLALGGLALVLPGVVIAVRAATCRPDRAWATWLALAAGSYAAGNVVYLAWVQYLDPVPFPTWADAGYLGFYPLALVGMLLSLRASAQPLRPGVLLDALMGALAASAVAVVVAEPLAPHFDGDVAAYLVSLAYPIGDVLVASAAVAVIAAGGGLRQAMYRCVAAGLAVFVCGDAVYGYRVALGTYEVGTFLDATWAVGLTLVAHGAWRPERPERPAQPAPGTRLQSLWIVGLAGLAALVVLGAATEVSLPRLAVALATAALVLGAARTLHLFRRVSDLATAEAEARTDHLTGVANRRELMERLEAHLRQRRPGESLGLLIIDVDRFKEVNDSLGHQAGDELLRIAAERLAEVTPRGALLARLGGDEFAVLLPGASADAVMAVAGDVHTSFQRPFPLTEMTVHVGASVGAAIVPDHAVSRTQLLQCADRAMYVAKVRRCGPLLYAGQDAPTDRGNLEIAEDLHRALDRGELVPHYQPKVTPAGQVAGVEALVRWQHPRRGLLAPGDFLSIAERHDLLPALTAAVLETALRDCALWWTRGRPLSVSVNVSAADLLDPGLVPGVRSLLLENGLPASALVLEITESAVMSDPEAATHTLRQLRDVGVELSVDDYGTGYSSLTYLRRLPVQELKLDASFVKDMASVATDAAIVESTIGMAHALGLRVVAEGVEDAETAGLLRHLQCDLVQGWHYTAARPAAGLWAWLEQWERGVARSRAVDHALAVRPHP